MHLIVCMSFFEAGPATRAAVQLAQVALLQPVQLFASSLPAPFASTLRIQPATLAPASHPVHPACKPCVHAGGDDALPVPNPNPNPNPNQVAMTPFLCLSLTLTLTPTLTRWR